MAIRHRVRHRRLLLPYLLAVCVMLSLGPPILFPAWRLIHGSCLSILSSFQSCLHDENFYPSGESSFLFDEGFQCIAPCATQRVRERSARRYYRPCCGYKPAKNLKKQLRWKIALLLSVILLALLAAACCLLISCIRKRRQSNEHYCPRPRWVNGDMERSLSRDRQITTSVDGNDDGSPWAEVTSGFGQLGCTKRAQHQIMAASRASGCGLKKMRAFDYVVLLSATDGFKSSSVVEPSIRGISSGKVFRGELMSDEGLETSVVVKRFDSIFSEKMSRHVSEDLNGQLLLRHRNLLCPLGYCLKDGHFYVVYEYMVNGSLDQHLFPKESSSVNNGLSWARRCRIIKGVAAGLHHLHKNDSVHGSVKTSNILLDQDMTSRLGDFSYSTDAFNPSSSLAPDFSAGSDIGDADIFCFGSVILDMLCDERWKKEQGDQGSIPTNWFLVDRVWASYGDGRILEAVDANLSAQSDFDEAMAERLLLVGLACSHPYPKQRPNMEGVVTFLAGNAALPEVPLQMPPNILVGLA